MHPCRLSGGEELQVLIPGRVSQRESLGQGKEPE